MSIRRLLSLALLATAGASASAEDPTYKEDEAAVAAVEKAGGIVGRGYAVARRPGVPPAPAMKDRKDLARGAKNSDLPVIRIDFGSAKVNDVTLKALAKPLGGFKYLAHVAFAGTSVTDTGLKQLAVCEGLTSLEIGPGGIKGTGLKELADLSLTTLSVHGTLLSRNGFKAVGSLKKLNSLVLSRSRVTDEDMKAVGELVDLVSLDLADTTVGDGGLPNLATLKKLRTLDLSRTRVTGTGLKGLAGLDALAALTLDKAPLTDAGLATLPKLPGLVSLDASNTAIAGAGLKGLAGCPKLGVLKLDSTAVNDAGAANLSACAALGSLNLNRTKVTDAGMKALAGLTSLYDLDLGGTAIGNAGLRELTGLKRMNTLNLAKTKVGDIGLVALAEMKGLTTLQLGGTPVTSAASKHIAEFARLSTLDLSGTKFGDAGLTELTEKLKDIGDLNLANTPVGESAAKLVAFPNLHSLNLNDSKVPDKAVKEFAALKNLTALSLARTPVTAQSLNAISDLREHLYSVDLTGSRFPPAKLRELRLAMPYTTVTPYVQ